MSLQNSPPASASKRLRNSRVWAQLRAALSSWLASGLALESPSATAPATTTPHAAPWCPTPPASPATALIFSLSPRPRVSCVLSRVACAQCPICNMRNAAFRRVAFLSSLLAFISQNSPLSGRPLCGRHQSLPLIIGQCERMSRTSKLSPCPHSARTIDFDTRDSIKLSHQRRQSDSPGAMRLHTNNTPADLDVGPAGDQT